MTLISTKNSTQQGINFLLFLVIAACYFGGTVVTSPLLILYFCGVILTIIFLLFANKSQQDRENSVTIFLLTLLPGLVLASINYYDYVNKGTFFLYSDQIHFYEQARIVSNQGSIKDCIIYASENYLEYNFIYGLNGILGYIDRMISNEVHLLPLLFSVSYFTALIPVFFYHTIILYLPSRISLKSSLYFGLATPIIAYSGYLLRDIHLALVFSFVFFLIVREISIVRILGLLLMIPVVAGMRLANVFLLIAIMIIYLFNNRTTRLIRFFSIVIIVVVGLYSAPQIASMLTSTVDRLDTYTTWTSEQVEHSDGLGKTLYKLPPVIKEAMIIANGLASFPFWNQLQSATDTPKFIMGSYDTIANIGWFFILSGIIYFARPIWYLLRQKKYRLLLLLVLLSFAYVASNVTNMDTRRIMYVYPLMTLPFLMVYYPQSKKAKRRHALFSIELLLGLSITYVFLKGF